MKIRIGFDIGSESIHSVIMDEKDKIIEVPEYIMHFGSPIDALRDLYEDIIKKYSYENIKSVVFTGGGGENLVKVLDVPFFFDTITIPIGATYLVPDAQYIFHIGARDPYYFEREQVSNENQSFTSDHGTGTKCGGGSGILFTKQCRRFYEKEYDVEIGDDRRQNRNNLQDRMIKVFDKASTVVGTSEKQINVGGRCGVVVQSDMIHLQNQGEQINDILSGMLERIIRNYKCDVLKTREFGSESKAIVTGGIFNSKHLVKILEEELDLKIELPEHFMAVGAIGAVLKSYDNNKKFLPNQLDAIASAEKSTIKMAPPLAPALMKVIKHDGENITRKHEDLKIFKEIVNEKNVEVLLGIDGGSTTTKAMIARADSLEFLAEICLYTSGQPLLTAQNMLRQISEAFGDSIKIKGVAYTGSSGAFYHRLFTDRSVLNGKHGLDLVKDEITCHAYGVKHYNNKVDTIFELGGQDAKFTVFNNDGTVKKSKMNLSCMAGTGQTMQNMVEMLGLDISSTFHEYALSAKATPIVDDTCGIFTEAGIARLIAMGFPKDEIAAAVVYGFMGGYVNKFIGNEKYGEFASAQGGPFNGDSCLAALALHSGMEVHAFPHRQLFGALGAVIALSKEITELENKKIEYISGFRGLEIADMKFENTVGNCSEIIDDCCGVKDCILQCFTVGGDKVFSGGACPKGNSSEIAKAAPNYVKMYKNLLEKHIKEFTTPIEENNDKERILIPRTLTFLNEKAVYYVALYKALGFEVAVSPETTDEMTNLGVYYSHSETCYPVKIAHGHVAYLKEYLRPGKDKILAVNAVGEKDLKFCPFISGDGFLAKEAVGLDNKDVLLPLVRFNSDDIPEDKSFLEDLERVFPKRFKLSEVTKAVNIAKIANEKCIKDLYDAGDKIVSKLSAKNEIIYFGIGRGYTLFDDVASSKVHELFAKNGLHFIPSFFLPAPEHDLENIADNMFWFQGEKIINYTLKAGLEAKLYPVRATNFNCGTDSMLLYHEEHLMAISKKPHLVLQTDGHSSNAQFGTRTLANHEVVKSHTETIPKIDDYKTSTPEIVIKNRIVGVPFMGTNSNVISAGYKALGYESEVLPTHTAASREVIRKNVSANTCRPFAFQMGDSLAWLDSLKERGIDPNRRAAVFEPMAKGPCRYGQYYVMMRKLFDRHGYQDVVIVNPDDAKDYMNMPLTKLEIAKQAMIIFKGFYANDLLMNSLLRTRPYENKIGKADKIYERFSRLLYRLVAMGAKTRQIIKLLTKAKKDFEACIDKSIKRKPIVLMNGEVFVRTHPGSNQNSVKLLEKYGLEVKMTYLSQWIEFTNRTAIRLYKDASDFKGLLASTLKKQYMIKKGKQFFEPFAEFLKGRESHESDHVLENTQDSLVYDRRIEGEAPVSIGEAHMFSKGEIPNICGIYHVGPFGCMQETAATSQIQSLAIKHRKEETDSSARIVPFMDAVFGDSELPNLEAEIAVFAEKCRLKQELIKKT